MNFDPRLPHYNDTGPEPTPDALRQLIRWIPDFIQRFYALWRELAQAMSLVEQTHGEWAPTITFATPGDVAASYSKNTGRWTRAGKLIWVDFEIATSAFSWTTAAGLLKVSGLPVLPASTYNSVVAGSCEYAGVSKAGYTQLVSRVGAGLDYILIGASGMGLLNDFVNAVDVPTGGTVVLRSTIFYRTD